MTCVYRTSPFITPLNLQYHNPLQEKKHKLSVDRSEVRCELIHSSEHRKHITAFTLIYLEDYFMQNEEYKRVIDQVTVSYLS